MVINNKKGLQKENLRVMAQASIKIDNIIVK